MQESNSTVLIVRRDDVTRCETLSVPSAPPQSGEVLLKVERFGLSSNNVTYATLGGVMAYDKFFPVPSEAHTQDWKCLPVWGVARVEKSCVDGLEAGERVYGFFPAASHATFAVAAPTGTGFRVDRLGIPPEYGFYHAYNVATRDPFFLADQEDLMVVLRPLFLTGLLLADYLEVSGYMGARSVLVSSAASKTSHGLAIALHRAGAVRLLGLTSAATKARAESLGVYDDVVTYDAIESLPVEASVYVDVSGSMPIRQDLARRLGSSLARVISVGLTHWQEGSYGALSAQKDLPVEVFFAPGWTVRRRKEAGDPFLMKLLTDWHTQINEAKQHYKVVQSLGPDELSGAYSGFARGAVHPDEARVYSI